MLIERNMEALFGVRFVASEHSTGKKHGGRIDSLGLDENGSPVIFEYKRSVNENVINQGLFYLDWLLDHRAEFELLVMKNLGSRPLSRSTGPARGSGRGPAPHARRRSDEQRDGPHGHPLPRVRRTGLRQRVKASLATSGL